MFDLIKNLVNNVKDFGIERVFKRYYSLYRAQVTDTEDPQHRGRIKIKIPAIFGDDELPYFAEPKDFRGASQGKGEFYPPDVDDWVYIEFEMGDHRFPVYSGGWHAESELDDTEFEHEADVPNTKGFQNKYGHVMKFSEAAGKEKIYFSTPKGHFFIIDDTDGTEQIQLIHQSGSRLVLDENGSFQFSSSDGAFVALDADQGKVLMNSASGASVSMGDDIVALNAAGNSMLHLDDGSAQLTTDGDLIQSANTWTMNTGSAVINAQGAQLKLGSGLCAIGAGPTELIDQVIQVLNALITAPTLVTTGTGPSSPITPPASVSLTQAMVLLTTIKGTLG